MSENVVTMEAGRQKRRERAEAKERLLHRRSAMGLTAPENAPATAPADLNAPLWPAGIDDLRLDR